MRHLSFNAAIFQQIIRLNPCTLPQSFSIFIKPQLWHAYFLTADFVHFSLFTDRKIISFPISIAIENFLGIAAEIVPFKNSKVISLFLLHEEPLYKVPLFVTFDLRELLQTWKLWASHYKLPMILMHENSKFSYVRDNLNVIHKNMNQTMCTYLSLRKKLFLSLKKGPI